MFFFIVKIAFNQVWIIMDITHDTEVFIITIELAWCKIPMAVRSFI